MSIGKLIMSSFAVVSLGACAHVHKVEGPEAKSEIPEGIRVQIGSPEVKEGDRVKVVRSKCNSTFAGEKGGAKRRCVNDKIGEAVVLKVLDHDAAVVQPESGIKIEQGMAVESLKD